MTNVIPFPKVAGAATTSNGPVRAAAPAHLHELWSSAMLVVAIEHLLDALDHGDAAELGAARQHALRAIQRWEQT